MSLCCELPKVMHSRDEVQLIGMIGLDGSYNNNNNNNNGPRQLPCGTPNLRLKIFDRTPSIEIRWVLLERYDSNQLVQNLKFQNTEKAKKLLRAT